MNVQYFDVEGIMKVELTINKSKDLPRGAIPALEKELLKRLQNQYGNCSLVTQSEKNTAEQQAKSRKTQAKRNEQKMTLTGPCRPKHVPLTAEASVTTSGFGSREDRAWVVESLVFSLTSAGFSYTYNLVVDIRKPAAASKKSEKQDKKGPSYFG